MDRASIAAIVDRALTELIDEQPELLDLGVTERALSHHLANYIAKAIDWAYHVDVEYNRQHLQQSTIVKRNTNMQLNLAFKRFKETVLILF